MSDFKYHINHRFGSCRLVAYARDPHRGRDVKLYHIPGNFEVVGIDDGIDCLISPISIDPFSVGIARIFDDIRAGKSIEVKVLSRSRVKIEPHMLGVQLPLEPLKRARVAIPVQPQSRSRIRV